MKLAKRRIEDGGRVLITHPDDAECLASAYTDSDAEQIFRLMERKRGLRKAEIPYVPFTIVYSK